MIYYMQEPCYVYVLINPGNKRPFYIGISNNPWSRFYSHQHDRASAAWPALRLLLGEGLFHRDEILKIYRCCPDRRTALDVEYNLVKATPKLLNRPYSAGRRYA